MKSHRWVLRAGALAVTLLATTAYADNPSQNADQLFKEGRALMERGHYAEAREKLVQSEHLDQGIGTLFNIADCDEHLGLIATAWNELNDVITQSRAANQPARVQIAEARAATLLPRLPRLVIEGLAPPGADVKKDGVVVPLRELGRPLPLDPGTHTIRVERGTHVIFEKVVTIAEGTLARVNIAPTAENKPEIATTTITSAPTPAFTPELVNVSDSPPPRESHPSAQKIIGGVLAGTGLATIGVGAYFGIDSIDKRNDSRAHCVGNACDATGVDLRNTAINAGNASTLLFIVGGAAAVGGGILFFTAAHHDDENAKTTPFTRLAAMRAAPYAGPTGSGLVLSGAFQ